MKLLVNAMAKVEAKRLVFMGWKKVWLKRRLRTRRIIADPMAMVVEVIHLMAQSGSEL